MCRVDLSRYPESDRYNLEARGRDLNAHRAHGIPVARLTCALQAGALVGRLRRRLPRRVPAEGDRRRPAAPCRRRGVPRRAAAFPRRGRLRPYDVARMAGDCPYIPVGLERVAGSLGLAPPQCSPRLAGAGAVLALQAFLSLAFGVFHGDVIRYRGLLNGLQVT